MINIIVPFIILIVGLMFIRWGKKKAVSDKSDWDENSYN